MYSNENKMCILFSIFMLSIYLHSAAATNIDCDGKAFHCVNSTHFMICVDLGAGVSKTVDDFVIQCPATTVCRDTNQFECEYQLPSTTPTNAPPGDKANDFTINTQITTTLSNDVTNTTSSIQKPNVTNLFKDYYDTMDVSTYTNYISDIPKYKVNENSGTSVIFATNKPLTSNDRSKPMAVATVTFETESLISKSPEINSQNNTDYLLQRNSLLSLFTKSEKVTSEKLIAEDNRNEITNITNISNRTSLNSDFLFIKPINNLYETTIETTRKDKSNLMDHEVNTFREVTSQAKKTENSSLFLTSIPFNFTTALSTSFTLYPTVENINNFENTSSKIEKILDKNISEVSVLKETDIISSFEYKISNLTENDNITTLSFRFEPTMRSIEHIAEATTMPTSNSYSTVSNNNETLSKYEHKERKPSEVEFNPTLSNTVTLKYENSTILSSNSSTDEIIMTSYDNLNSENVTTASEVLVKQNIKKIVTERIFILPQENIVNNISTVNDLLAETSTIVTENCDIKLPVSSVEYPTTPKLDIFEKNIKDTKVSTSLTDEHHMLNLSMNTSFYLTKDNCTTSPLLTISDSTTKSEIRDVKPPEVEFNPMLSNAVTLKYENSIILSSKSSTHEISMTSYDNLNSENVTIAPEVLMKQKNQKIITERIFTLPQENVTNKFSTVNDLLEETSTIVTDNYDIKLPVSSVEYSTTPKLNIFEQNIKDTKISTSLTDERHMSNLSMNTSFYLTKNDYTTSPSLATFDSITKSSEYMTDALKGTKISSNNASNNKILQDQMQRQVSELTLTTETNSAVFTSLFLKYYFKQNTGMEMNTVLTTHSNIIEQSTEVMTTKKTGILDTTQQHKISHQDENIIQISYPKITENPYLTEHLIKNHNVHTSTLNEQYISSSIFPVDISTTTENPRHSSINTEVLLPIFGFTTLSELSTLELAGVKKIAGGKDVIESAIVPYSKTNENASLMLQYQNEREISRQVTTTPASFDSTSTKYSTMKPIAEDFVVKINDDENILKYKQLNSSLDLEKNNNKYIGETITSPTGLPFINTEDVVGNINFNESIPLELELMTVSTSNNISEIKENGLLNEAQLSGNVLLHNRQNKTITWLDVIFPTTEHLLIPKNDTPILNAVTANAVLYYVDPIEITTEATKTFGSSNSYTTLAMFPHKKRKETVFPTDKSNVIANKTYYMGHIQIDPKTLNQEIFNGTTKVTLGNQIIGTTQMPPWKKINSSTHILVTNNKNTTKPLIPDIDVIFSNNNHSILTKKNVSLLSTETPNHVVINSENSKFERNKYQVIPGNINRASFSNKTIHLVPQQLSIENIMSIKTKKNFTLTNSGTLTNDTDSEVQKSDKSYSIPINTLTTLENFKVTIPIETPENPVTNMPSSKQNFNTMKDSDDIFETFDFTYNYTKEIRPVNINTNFINNQSIIQSVNFPTHIDSKNNCTINDSNTLITAPRTDSNVLLLDIQKNISTSKKLDMENHNLNTFSENQIAIKQSVFKITEAPSYDKVFKIKEPNDYPRLTMDVKSQRNSEVTLMSTTSETSEIMPKYSQTVSEITDELYLQSKHVNGILKKPNTIQTTANNTSHGTIPNTPVMYLFTTESYQRLIPVLLKQPLLHVKLNKSLPNSGFRYRSTRGSNNVNYTKKVENIQMIPRLPYDVNKTNFNTTSLVKTVTWNRSNITMKNDKRFISATSFRCNNRSRGRFADKNNCIKYYICIGKIQPILGECPNNTVFSEIKKQCTKNLSHCIRNNEFRCLKEGRFSDVLRSNVYYICVSHNNSYIRFQFQCQNGYHLNKTNVKCENNIKYQFKITSISIDSDSSKPSDQSTVEHDFKEKETVKENAKHICNQEGKFPDAEDCRRYYMCSKTSKSVFRRRTKKCDSDEVFHREKKKCVDRDSYECN